MTDSPVYKVLIVLIVDDEESIRTFSSTLGHLCVTTIDGLDALDKMKQNGFAIRLHNMIRDSEFLRRSVGFDRNNSLLE